MRGRLMWACSLRSRCGSVRYGRERLQNVAVAGAPAIARPPSPPPPHAAASRRNAGKSARRAARSSKSVRSWLAGRLLPCLRVCVARRGGERRRAAARSAFTRSLPPHAQLKTHRQALHRGRRDQQAGVDLRGAVHRLRHLRQGARGRRSGGGKGLDAARARRAPPKNSSLSHATPEHAHTPRASQIKQTL